MKSAESLETIALELKNLSTEYSRRSWARYTTGLDFGVNEAYEKIVDLLKNKSHWDTIQNLAGIVSDPAEARKLQIMENTFKPFHLSDGLNKLALDIQQLTSKLSSVLNSHRCSVNGKQITSPDMEKILSSSPDREFRKAVFLSRSQVSRPLVDTGFLDLVAMRKEYALKTGASDFVRYSLKEQELNPEMCTPWRDELKLILPLMQQTRSDFAGGITGSEHVMPWDETFIASSIAPELNSSVDMAGFLSPIDALFERFGFDISTMNITYDVFPRKNKSEWGYNFTIEMGTDSRILANVRDRFSDFGVLLHETGHAVHSFASNPGQIILNRGISGIVSEGIANLFGSFRTRKVFYSQFFQSDDTPGNFKKLNKWSRACQLRALGRIFFDQALYTAELKSLDDINELYWNNTRDLFQEEPYADQPVWANTIHYTTHPIYLHNYLLGDLTCDMLEDVFLRKESLTDMMQKPEAFGSFVKEEVIDASGRYPFPELFKRISGEDLSLSFLTSRIIRELQN